jgi:ribosome-binding protein aMBF1 (putative translation factor)
MYYRRRPLKPPITRCELCGRSLYGEERYHVRIVLRQGPLRGATVKVLHVCKDCLLQLKNDRELARKFKIKYYRMPTLG